MTNQTLYDILEPGAPFRPLLIRVPLNYDKPEEEEGKVFTPSLVPVPTTTDTQLEHLDTLRRVKFIQSRGILAYEIELSKRNTPISDSDKSRGYPSLVTSTKYWFLDQFSKFLEGIEGPEGGHISINPLEYGLLIEENGHNHLFLPTYAPKSASLVAFRLWLQIMAIDGSLSLDHRRLPKNVLNNTHRREGALSPHERIWYLRKVFDFRKGFDDLYSKAETYPGLKIIRDLDKDPTLEEVGLPRFKEIARFKTKPTSQKLEERVLPEQKVLVEA